MGLEKIGPMSNNTPEHLKPKDEPTRPQKVLQWAMCHPGVLLLGSIAVGTILVRRRESSSRAAPDQRAKTETDVADGDVPLFI